MNYEPAVMILRSPTERGARLHELSKGGDHQSAPALVWPRLPGEPSGFTAASTSARPELLDRLSPHHYRRLVQPSSSLSSPGRLPSAGGPPRPPVVRPLLVDRVLVAAHDLAVADLTAPALDLLLVQHGLGHHVAGVVLELQPGPAPLGPPQVPGVLEEPLRVVLQDQRDPGELRCQ